MCCGGRWGATYSSDEARRDRGTDAIAPRHDAGSGVVVRSAVLVRAVVEAVMERRLGAKAVDVSTAAAESSRLSKHVGGTRFLASCQYETILPWQPFDASLMQSTGSEEAILTAQSGKLGGKPSWAATSEAPATAMKRVDFIVKVCGQETEPGMMSS